MYSKLTHFTQQSFHLNGVLHVGANDGEEVQCYKEMGIQNIICFEPLSTAYQTFKENYPDVLCYNIALGNFNGKAVLDVAYGDGKGSSLLKVKEDHPEVLRNWNQGQQIVVRQEEVEVMRLSSWAAKHCEDFDIEDYNCLLLDTQGNELDVLKGAEKFLRLFDYLCIELSEDPIYIGEAPADEVSAWLDNKGFLRDSPVFSHDDVFYINKQIKGVSDQIYRGLA